MGVEGKSTLQAQSWWFWAPYAAQGQVPSSFQFKLESSLDPRLPSPPTDSSTDHQPLLGLRSSSDTKLLRSQIPSWTPRFFYSISNSSAVTSSPRLPTPAFASSSDRFSTSRLLLGWSPQTSIPNFPFSFLSHLVDVYTFSSEEHPLTETHSTCSEMHPGKAAYINHSHQSFYPASGHCHAPH